MPNAANGLKRGTVRTTVAMVLLACKGKASTDDVLISGYQEAQSMNPATVRVCAGACVFYRMETGVKKISQNDFLVLLDEGNATAQGCWDEAMAREKRAQAKRIAEREAEAKAKK